MIGRFLLLLLTCVAWQTISAELPDSVSIEIDLQDQMAYLIRGGRAVISTPISSGRSDHQTETGSFIVAEKERSYFSSLYGRILDARGDIIETDADPDMPVPRGGRFVPASMRFFLRFHGSIGMHAGYLPGYAASHGCVRLPEAPAMAFFNAASVGTPVTVFGTTARHRAADEPGTLRTTREVRALNPPRWR